MSNVLRLGGREVTVDEARGFVVGYVSGVDGVFAYPSYDGYYTNGEPYVLCDGDLLAPVLLNVPVKLRTFAELRQRVSELECGLQQVPSDPLVELDDAGCERVGAIFGILDGGGPHGALMTTLSRILHRKRPATIPLHAELVRSLYQPDRIPIDGSRNWAMFATLFCMEVRSDLHANLEVWTELSELTEKGQPPITPLRALDIVAWSIGKHAAT